MARISLWLLLAGGALTHRSPTPTISRGATRRRYWMRPPYQAIQVIAVDNGCVVLDSNECVAPKLCESLTEALTQSAVH
ncbi:MAG: hypothetical protein M3294_05365 [Pseudomonadota bacterium]|nr:hypothetical protein [Pseudomonadota bacterium]